MQPEAPRGIPSVSWEVLRFGRGSMPPTPWASPAAPCRRPWLLENLTLPSRAPGGGLEPQWSPS